MSARVARLLPIEGRRPTASNSLTLDAPETFEQGAGFTVRARGEAGYEAVLHYRHVNQAERWCMEPMRHNGEIYLAEIPADYTRSPYHLQFYVTSSKSGENGISPGLAPDLANQPYRIALQA